jgi:hypothetical protein
MLSKVYIRRNGLNYHFYKSKEEPDLFLFKYNSKIFKRPYGTLYNKDQVEIAQIKPVKRIFGYKTEFDLIAENYAPKTNFIENVSFFKGHWKINVGDTTFDFYLNNDSKASIFKNEKQISSITKDFVEFFDSCDYVLETTDIDTIFYQICLLLAVNFGNTNEESAFTIDLGNPLYKKFDKNWLTK